MTRILLSSAIFRYFLISSSITCYFIPLCLVPLIYPQLTWQIYLLCLFVCLLEMPAMLSDCCGPAAFSLLPPSSPSSPSPPCYSCIAVRIGSVALTCVAQDAQDAQDAQHGRSQAQDKDLSSWGVHFGAANLSGSTNLTNSTQDATSNYKLQGITWWAGISFPLPCLRLTGRMV